jgi:hypothetical protein
VLLCRTIPGGNSPYRERTRRVVDVTMKYSNRKKSRHSDRPTLPELDQTKRSVLNSLASLQSRRFSQGLSRSALLLIRRSGATRSKDMALEKAVVGADMTSDNGR